MTRAVVFFYVLVLAAMIAITTAAGLDRGIFDALEALWPDLWFRATLADAYFAFLSVYLFVLWRERSAAAKALWLVLFLGLGSMGIAAYVLSGIYRYGGVRGLLAGEAASGGAA